MSDMPLAMLEERKREAYRVAAEIYRQKPDWVTFLREVMGVDGVVPRLFPNQGAIAAFEATPEYEAIQKMLATLRNRNSESEEDREPLRVITVRLPRSLHEMLRSEATRKQVSLNKLCIAKLLHVISGQEGPGELGDLGEIDGESGASQDEADYMGGPGVDL